MCSYQDQIRKFIKILSIYEYKFCTFVDIHLFSDIKNFLSLPGILFAVKMIFRLEIMVREHQSKPFYCFPTSGFLDRKDFLQNYQKIMNFSTSLYILIELSGESLWQFKQVYRMLKFPEFWSVAKMMYQAIINSQYVSSLFLYLLLYKLTFLIITFTKQNFNAV